VSAKSALDPARPSESVESTVAVAEAVAIPLGLKKRCLIGRAWTKHTSLRWDDLCYFARLSERCGDPYFS
jgi:hypothetical protein